MSANFTDQDRLREAYAEISRLKSHLKCFNTVSGMSMQQIADKLEELEVEIMELKQQSINKDELIQQLMIERGKQVADGK